MHMAAPWLLETCYSPGGGMTTPAPAQECTYCHYAGSGMLCAIAQLKGTIQRYFQLYFQILAQRMNLKYEEEQAGNLTNPLRRPQKGSAQDPLMPPAGRVPLRRGRQSPVQCNTPGQCAGMACLPPHSYKASAQGKHK